MIGGEMRDWERRVRLRTEESAEIRRFVEAQARKTEAESSLRRSETNQLTVEAEVKELERRNNAVDNFRMEVARQRVDRVEANIKHVRAVLGKEAL
jgi:septal ring factor EnvC (AmiA/AmiB activator)